MKESIRDKWAEYEKEKAKIKNIGLSCEEYDEKIKEICDRLGI